MAKRARSTRAKRRPAAAAARTASAQGGSPAFAALLERLGAIVAALPDTKLTFPWGEPHFRVADKIFLGCGEKAGRLSIGFKAGLADARELLRDPRFRPAPYVGRHGWVEMDASAIVDWDEVRGFVLQSWRLIAPAASRAKLGGADDPAGPPRARARVTAPAARRTPARRARRATR